MKLFQFSVRQLLVLVVLCGVLVTLIAATWQEESRIYGFRRYMMGSILVVLLAGLYCFLNYLTTKRK